MHRVSVYELRSSSGMRWRLALPLDDWRQRPVRPQDPARTPKTWRDPHGAHELADRARGPLPAVNRGDWPGTAPREELMAGDARLGRCRRHSFIPGSGGPRALLDRRRVVFALWAAAAADPIRRRGDATSPSIRVLVAVACWLRRQNITCVCT